MYCIKIIVFKNIKRFITFNQGKQEQSKNSNCATKAHFYIVGGVNVFIGAVVSAGRATFCSGK